MSTHSSDRGALHYMSSSLNSLKGLYRVIPGTTIGLIKWDTRSLDYGSHGPKSGFRLEWGLVGPVLGLGLRV